MENENDLKVVRIKNIADFDFTGELGARYGGRDFFIPAGKSLLMPLTVGDHLATHLARAIMLKRSPTRTEAEMDGKGSVLPLWSDEAVANLKKQIIEEVYEEERAPVQSEAERMHARVQELNKSEAAIAAEDSGAPSGGNVSAADIVPVDEQTGPIVYQDKSEVIAALEKKGIKFDARSSKANLEALLQ